MGKWIHEASSIYGKRERNTMSQNIRILLDKKKKKSRKELECEISAAVYVFLHDLYFNMFESLYQPPCNVNENIVNCFLHLNDHKT